MDIIIETSGTIEGGNLAQELDVAGIAHSGVTPNGNLLTLHGIDPAQELLARNVVAAHDPNIWSQRAQRIRDRLAAAISYLKQFVWSRTTQTEWQTYFDQNLSDVQVDALVNTITNIPTAQDALRTMWKKQNAMTDRLTKVEIALRDVVKPDNPES